MKYTTTSKTTLADTITPVLAYLNIRKHYSTCLLLESSDYHTKENTYSLLCCEPLETFETTTATPKDAQQIENFKEEIVCDTDCAIAKQFNSIFGFSSFEAVQGFESIQLLNKEGYHIPLNRYQFFRFLIVFNHFNNEITFIENCPQGESSQLNQFTHNVLQTREEEQDYFKKVGERYSPITDSEFQNMVNKGKEHCQQGDVFQLVLSRKFEQKYDGDNFLLYRILRSINPSPFSFYFGYNDFQIFGASPEAQLLVRDGLAEIHPIAGTYKRTGNDEQDAKRAKELAADQKENAEHVMLVDLARNDLGKSSSNIQVATYKDIQFYSHVIHLVSKVTGQLNNSNNAIQLFADTFPAGTLTGAPKYRAMQLINQYEKHQRGIYGGSIGAFGLNGDVNQAIAIRTFFVQNNTLYYQAGAGIVIDSDAEKENLEVYHKLRALEKAMQQAEEQFKQ